MQWRWRTLRVELVSGRGEDYDPPPGRVLAIPPRRTFQDLAIAIDLAFARWDLGHLSVFELADGTQVMDDEMAHELISSGFGPMPKTLPLSAAVSNRVKEGQGFTYTFDLGDDWLHVCTGLAALDPYEYFGAPIPTGIVPIWGWGSIPDQYGRRWEEDDGESEPPIREYAEPESAPSPTVDIALVEQARSAKDLIAALSGTDVDD